MKLVLARAASDDLSRLRAFVAAHDPLAATRIASDLRARVAHLRTFPDMGHLVPETPGALPLREFAFGDFVVRYLRLEASLVVLRIWHHRENRR